MRTTVVSSCSGHPSRLDEAALRIPRDLDEIPRMDSESSRCRRWE